MYLSLSGEETRNQGPKQAGFEWEAGDGFGVRATKRTDNILTPF